jgi:starch synthase (maltosyl-transferring)
VTLGPIVIDMIRPATPGGAGMPKTSTGEPLPVSARVFRDGHDLLAARVRWRPRGGRSWKSAPLGEAGGDQWIGMITCDAVGPHQFRIEAWTDEFSTWRKEVRIKVAVGDDVSTELEEGARILEHLLPEVRGKGATRVADAITAMRRTNCTQDVRLNAALDDALVPLVSGIPHQGDLTASEDLALWVDRERARYSAWYEFFPRSEGGFKGAAERLDAVAAMGFDVVYLPPIHPIGTTARKGKNNTLDPGPDDVGSPWAIGSPEGGHTAIHPDLGDEADFLRLVERAQELGMEIALDYALQCSPDHPWVKEHPEWFHQRPDGTIKYAENPPKKYQDIYPINFWPEDDQDRQALWDACRDALLHWIERDVRIFRVDNPHTKPLAFWQWCIAEIQKDHPDVLFLAEAFTRPAMMSKLAEIGFSQSYTYFTWRHGKQELMEYVTELAHSSAADVMRPNFWPNTPDILGGVLRNGNRAAFLLRYLLAATLVPNHGLYSGYELLENEPASDTNEEYLNSEKYEIKIRDWDREDSITPFITQVNEIRRQHPAFSLLRNIHFHHVDNDAVIAYSKGSRAAGDVVLVVVNLDPHNVQEATVHLDLPAIGLPEWGPFRAHDELTGETYQWNGPANYVRFDPGQGHVGHVLDLAPTSGA